MTSRYVTLCVTVRLAIRCHSKRHNIILGNALRFSVRIPAETNSSLNTGSDSSTVKRSEKRCECHKSLEMTIVYTWKRIPRVKVGVARLRTLTAQWP